MYDRQGGIVDAMGAKVREIEKLQNFSTDSYGVVTGSLHLQYIPAYHT
jgi:hypothetical protein